MLLWRLLMIATLLGAGSATLVSGAAQAQAQGVERPSHRRGPKPSVRKIKREKLKYKVMRGDSLKSIAARYKITEEEIKRWNPSVSRQLTAGRTLIIWATQSPGVQIIKEHTVQKGESLAEIAKKYGVKMGDLRNWNPTIKAGSLKAGAKVKIVSWKAAPQGTSRGAANGGRLDSAQPLTSGKGFFVRNPDRAYGTEIALNTIVDCIGETRDRFPKAHDLFVGDLSFKGGGYMKPHKSHQSGRDADISYYIKGGPDARRFTVATRQTLDVEKTWDLFERFIESGKVVYIFVDYSLQEVLYEHAQKKGKKQEFLDKVFQYPRGRGHSVGIIRYSRGHDDHFHIRFKCDSKDENCR